MVLVSVCFPLHHLKIFSVCFLSLKTASSEIAPAFWQILDKITFMSHLIVFGSCTLLLSVLSFLLPNEFVHKDPCFSDSET